MFIPPCKTVISLNRPPAVLINHLINLTHEAPVCRTGRDGFVEGDDDAVVAFSVVTANVGNQSAVTITEKPRHLLQCLCHGTGMKHVAMTAEQIAVKDAIDFFDVDISGWSVTGQRISFGWTTVAISFVQLFSCATSGTRSLTAPALWLLSTRQSSPWATQTSHATMFPSLDL